MFCKYNLYHQEERELTVTDNTWLRVSDGGSIVDDKVVITKFDGAKLFQIKLFLFQK